MSEMGATAANVNPGQMKRGRMKCWTNRNAARFSFCRDEASQLPSHRWGILTALSALYDEGICDCASR
jgi:hypothetical protein